jgi:DNA helicase-2/ATP-dependent DNA helicase PcrA
MNSRSMTDSARVPAPLFTPRPRSARQRPASLVDVVLDPAQRAAVERPAGRSLLVLGEAGHGKTTVALHRLAHLWRSSPTPLRAAVVVPNEGLARLIQPLLRRVGVDLEVLTYDRWASAQARRAFRRLPRESDATPPSVMHLKRHPALRVVLEAVADRAPGRVDDDVDAPTPSRSARVTRGDLQHLFGDRLLVERVARAAGLSARAVDDTLDRSRIQFSATAEEEWAHVDRRRLVAVDRRALDDGTSSGDVKTVDVEDYAVLFELDRLRAGKQGRPPASRRTYDVLMLDEAQELAPLELALLGRSLAPGGMLIVAGDADQQTDATTTFQGWPDTMRELGCSEYDAVTLEVGYRCAPDVVALARVIRGPGSAGPAHAGGATRTFAHEAELDAWLADGLRALQRRDPRASVAAVCRSPLTARRLVDALHAAEVPARVVFDGRFLPRGPVQVSTVDEVKGLEFDFVVVPDASARQYPDVAVTRARHQVALACVGEPSAVVR